VGPATPASHREAVLAVYRAVDAACPDGLCAFVGPVDVPVGEAAVYAPDVVVWPADEHGVGPPLLVAEVLGDGGGRDPRERAGGYRDAGVGCYLVVDPDAACVTVVDLGDGGGRAASGAGAAGGRLPPGFAVPDLSGVPGLRRSGDAGPGAPPPE
jgi:hypothetical protein